MDGHVLVLNATWEPLHVVPIRRAIVLLLKDKAEIVEAAEAGLRAERQRYDRPLVIRLVAYARVPRATGLPLTRRLVLARDRFTCQYCGRQPGKSSLTLDHVVPRSRGGANTWENIVTACAACNHRKGNRTPAEAGMPLRSQPARPRYVAVVLLGRGGAPSVWRKYLPEL